MSGRYDDMIYMQNPTPTCKPRMSLYERAARFSPFAALTGYENAVEAHVRWTSLAHEP